MEAQVKQNYESSTQTVKDENCDVTYLKEVKNVKTDVSTSVSTTTKKYKFGEEIADTTDVVLKNVEYTENIPSYTPQDKDGQEETNSFLYLYDKYKKKGDNLFLEEDAEKELYELLEEESDSGRDTSMDAYILKYLLYVYDKIDRGVTEFDLSLFKPKEFKKVHIAGGMAIVEVLRSYENNWLREYRNGTASAGTINYVLEKQYARVNEEGEVEYGLDELHYKSDDSLNYSYGLLICTYKNGVAGTILEDKLAAFQELGGIDLHIKVNEYVSSGGANRGWVNADIADEVQIKLINDTKEKIRQQYADEGVDLTNNEVDALTVVSYGYGNAVPTTSGVNLLKEYKATEDDTEKETLRNRIIQEFSVNGGRFHPFVYGDWVRSGRAETIIQMFFEGRYILSDGTEVMAAGTIANWDGDTYQNDLYTFPVYRQDDPRWGSKQYGAYSIKTIESSGCGCCSMAAILSGYLGEAITPDILTDILNELYPSGIYYAYGSGSTSYLWSNETVAYFNCSLAECNKDQAIDALKLLHK